jgi:predicted dehydrogenase
MGERRFRVGIIGLGAMGHSLAQTCRAEADVEIVAGCDVLEEKRRAWGTALRLADDALYADYEEMLGRERLDLVIVATHAPAHHAPVLRAARHSVHVLCEKPMAVSLREADDMVAACAAAGVKLAINHVKRGSRGNDVARTLITDGAIGTPYLVRGEGKGHRWAGSELMEMGTHLFDWLRLLFGDPWWLFAHVVQNGHPAGPADIVHSLDLPYPERDCGLVLGERAYCALGFSTGLHADIGFLAQPVDHIADYGVLTQPTDEDAGYGFDICGTEGILALRRSVGTDIFLQRGHHRGPLGAGLWERIPVDEYAGLAPPVGPANAAGERLACQRRLLRDLLDAIATGDEPSSSGRDGRAALELTMAVWQSQREGRPVTLPLPQREHPLERWRAECTDPLNEPDGAM